MDDTIDSYSNQFLKLILNLNENERNYIYKKLIKYCGSKDRVFINEEIKKYRHKGVYIYIYIYFFFFTDISRNNS